MKNIFIIVVLAGLTSILSFVNAQTINEYKSDLYYANGIMMGETEVQARELWKNKTRQIFTNINFDKSIGKVDIAYNASENFFYDMYEAYQQYSDEKGWVEYLKYRQIYFKDGIPEFVTTYRPDLAKQIQAYIQSIRLGHGVIVVAHSQGNFYTNEAYVALDSWMRQYLHMIGVASPASYVSGDGPHVRFDNNIIKLVPGALGATHNNPNSSFLISLDAHDFYNSYLANCSTRAFIQNFIFEKIEEHKNADSQWEIEDKVRQLAEEFKKLKYQSEIDLKMKEILEATNRTDISLGSDYENNKGKIGEAEIDYILKIFSEKTVTLKHKYDQYNMGKIENVIPFNTNKKLYAIYDDTTPILASYGATEFSSEDEYLVLNNIEKEWIPLLNPFLALTLTVVCLNDEGSITKNETTGIIKYYNTGYEDFGITEDMSQSIIAQDIPNNDSKKGCYVRFLFVPFDGTKFFNFPGLDNIQNNYLHSFASKINNELFGGRYLITF